MSIDAREGITTGLSASDRLATIKDACLAGARPQNLVRPGHILPLRAHEDGVFGRNGHTEGSIDLMLLAGLKPMAVLCELMNDDGTMSRLSDLVSFGSEHDLSLLSINDIIRYRALYDLANDSANKLCLPQQPGLEYGIRARHGELAIEALSANGTDSTESTESMKA